MSSLNTPSPVGDASSVGTLTPGLSMGHRGEIVKTGNLRKLKTNKKKYFVLRCESVDYPARLEYYDSEKKFKAHQQPKRSISLKACFNINRRTDFKSNKYVIALYTKDDCFCIVLESEEERESWLKSLWALQDGDDVTDGEIPKPVFEHVWKVEVANKGLGATRKINGPYHLCLSGRTVSLVRILPDETKEVLEFPHQNIRSFGYTQSFFYMEVGRNAVTGTGDIWMLAEDTVIAKEINRAVSAMRKKNDDDDSGSKQIERSASVSESSRPISMSSRRHNNSVSERHEEGGSLMPNTNETTAGYIPNMDSYCEMRPSARFVSSDHDGSALNRTGSVPYNFLYCQLTQRCAQQQQQQQHQCRVNNNVLSNPNRRRHSVSGSSAGRDRSDSLPSSVRASAENHALSHGSVVSHGHHGHYQHSRNMHSHFISSYRPHSMYTRGISHSPPVIGSSPVSPASGACSTDSAGSSLSIDEGDGWVDGNDMALIGTSNRYSTNHPMTPESPIEEECDDYVHWNGPSGLDSGVGDDEKINNYMPMDRSSATLSLPIQQPHTGSTRKFSPGRSSQGASVKVGTSPSQSNYMDMNSPCGSSPMETPGNYMIMSPGNAPDSVRNATFHNRNVQQMHTAPSSANHSRTSSLAEETPDGYMPMMPGQTDDGYVDMDPSAHDGPDDFHHGEMSPSSSCSITSGTPSTDLRFSEYPLEKVNSYLTPSEEEEAGERPTRCYSVGSKPDSLNKKNRIDFIQTDGSRARAFSVGSRNAPGSKYMSRPLGHDIHATRHTLQAGGHFVPSSQQRQQTGGGKKSSSAPILSNPLSSSPMNRQILGGSHSSVEPLDDLMEMDFSPSVPNSSKNKNKNVGKPGGRSKSTSVNDYVSMSPGDRLSVPAGGPSHHSSQSSVASSYSTADGVDVAGHIGSPIGPGSPPKTSVLRSVYSGAIGRSPPENMARSPPSRCNPSPRSAVARMSCISELKPQNFPMTTPSPPIKPSLLTTNNSTASMAAKMAKMAVSSPYVEMCPSNVTTKPVIATSSASKPSAESGPYVEMRARTSSGSMASSSKPSTVPASSSNEDYLDMSFKPRRTSVPECKDLSNADGYVEMGWKSANSEADKPRKSSLDSQRSSANDDYMPMSGGSFSKNRRDRRGSTKRDRPQLRSQPINIQQPAQQNRKIVMDTPPKVTPGFLPLGTSLDSQSPLSSPFSSLGRNRNHKLSKESSNTASGVATPTGSNSTIFPISLNSPGSPLKPFTTDPLSSAQPPASTSSFDNLEKVPADMSSGTLRLSYPHEDTSKSKSTSSASHKQDLPKHDYVNFNPASSELAEMSDNSATDDVGDYAVMCPGASPSISSKVDPQRKISVTTMSTSSGKPEKKLPTDVDLGLNVVSRSSDFSRPSSKPLTVSSLLGMNNLSPTSSTEPQNILNSSAAATSKLLTSRQQPAITSITEKKIQNYESNSLSPCDSGATTTRLEGEHASSGLESVVGSNLGQPTASDAPVVPMVQSSPTLSPSPSQCSEGSANGCGLREKKMSSGSDSSTASRDSQLLVRKYSAGSVSPTGSSGKNKASVVNDKSGSTQANRRLSCPSKSPVSRQFSASSDVSDSQLEESRISDSASSLSRQTSSSSASGEASSSTLALTEKRSLSCSPVPSSPSPVPRLPEREINYAALDLPTSSTSEDSCARSPRSLKTQGSLSESQSSTSTPSPNPPGGAFTYAQIDFEKSEELRVASAAKSVKQ